MLSSDLQKLSVMGLVTLYELDATKLGGDIFRWHGHMSHEDWQHIYAHTDKTKYTDASRKTTPIGAHSVIHAQQPWLDGERPPDQSTVQYRPVVVDDQSRGPPGANAPLTRPTTQAIRQVSPKQFESPDGAIIGPTHEAETRVFPRFSMKHDPTYQQKYQQNSNPPRTYLGFCQFY